MACPHVPTARLDAAARAPPANGFSAHRLPSVQEGTRGADTSLLHNGHGPVVMSLLWDRVVSALLRLPWPYHKGRSTHIILQFPPCNAKANAVQRKACRSAIQSLT